MPFFQHRDSKIKPRTDNAHKLPLIDYKFPYVPCTDPKEEDKYLVRIFFDKPESLMLMYHSKLKSLVGESEKIKIFFTIVTSWMKHYLYDPSIKFETFS
jgi:hypothetical protein